MGLAWTSSCLVLCLLEQFSHMEAIFHPRKGANSTPEGSLGAFLPTAASSY